MTGFPPLVAEKLGYYVYMLFDPADGPGAKPFYVGKGVGDRMFAHVAEALAGVRDTPKLGRIRALHEGGRQVRYEILRSGLTEPSAYAVEAAAIQLLGLAELLNAVAGHNDAWHGRMSVDDVIAIHGAEPAPPITDPCVLIRIPKLWYPGMDPEALYEATAGWWKVGPKREQAKYAFSVNRGVIREIYAIDGLRPRKQGDRDWEHDPPGRPRWGFAGAPAPEMAAFRNKSVKHLLKPGMASPVVYLNCT